MDNLFNQQMLLMYGKEIPNGSLKDGNAPPELLKLYQTWLNAIFDTKWPGYYAKHVAIYFIYKAFVIKWIDMNSMIMSLRMGEKGQEKGSMIGKSTTQEQKLSSTT